MKTKRSVAPLDPIHSRLSLLFFAFAIVMAGLSIAVAQSRGKVDRSAHPSKDLGGVALRTRVVSDEGALVIYDAPRAEGEPRGPGGYLAYWKDFAADEVFVYRWVMQKRSEVMDALLWLQRDFGVDPQPLAAGIFRNAPKLADVHTIEFVDGRGWVPATRRNAMMIAGLWEAGEFDVSRPPPVIAQPQCIPCDLAAAGDESDTPGIDVDDPYEAAVLMACGCCEPTSCPPSCYDANLCTSDYCEVTCGGSYCAHEPRECYDGSLCTSDSCNPSTGVCEFWPKNCNDSNVCTHDYCCMSTSCCVNGNCVSEGSCVHAPRCSGGTCCPHGGSFSCCYPPTTKCCNNPDHCCEPTQTCCGEGCCSTGAACCNGDCQQGCDTFCCATGWCEGPCCPGGPNGCCDAGQICCDGVCCGSVCNPGSCECADPECQTHVCVTQPACDDGQVCTNDLCTVGQCGDYSCTHYFNSAPCAEDGNPCTSDVCSNGLCTHPSCCNYANCPDDGNVCTEDYCQNGECIHPCWPLCSTTCNAGTQVGWCDPCDCAPEYCSISITDGEGCPGETVELTVQGSCGPQCVQSMIWTITSTSPYLTGTSGSLACAGESVQATVSIAADAPPGPIPITINGTTPLGGACTDTATIQVAGVVALEWIEYAPESTPLDGCPNNGGKRVFPDKRYVIDPSSNIRNLVTLKATVSPIVEGCNVHFRVFDVDDPFDQNKVPCVPGNSPPG